MLLPDGIWIWLFRHSVYGMGYVPGMGNHNRLYLLKCTFEKVDFLNATCVAHLCQFFYVAHLTFFRCCEVFV